MHLSHSGPTKYNHSSTVVNQGKISIGKMSSGKINMTSIDNTSNR